MDEISFAGEGLAPDLVPTEELADCAATVLGADGARILSYGTGAGYTPLRELLAEQFGVHPYRVLLTNGWLQGFALLTQRRVAGRNVIIEYPTYDRALKLLFRAGASMLYVDRNEDGLSPEALQVHLRTTGTPALAYTIPTFHNPTGLTLTTDQRIQIGSLLHRSQAMIVEDDSYGLLRYEGEPQPTMFELSVQTAVYSFSFSQTIAPGLRVGVFILPNDLARELTAAANSNYITPVLLSQATVFEFLRRGQFDSNLELLKSKLAERRDAMLAGLERHFPTSTWIRPEGGIFIFLRLPPGSNAEKVVEQAEGVTAAAGFEAVGFPNAIRLCFAGCGLDEIEPGIERLAAAFESMPV